MASPRHSAKSRDAALRRLSTLNRLAAVGAVCLTLGFTALAVQATPPQRAAAAVAPATAPARSAPRSEDDDDRSAPAPAPAATQQPPVVVSGGS